MIIADVIFSGIRKSILKYGNVNAKFTIILGEDELQANSVVLKNMNESTQETISIDELLNKLTILTK